jgi:hypothetical protein
MHHASGKSASSKQPLVFVWFDRPILNKEKRFSTPQGHLGCADALSKKESRESSNVAQAERMHGSFRAVVHINECIYFGSHLSQ